MSKWTMTRKNKSNLSPLEKLLPLQVWTLRRSGNWLTKHLSFAIEHLPDKEELIYKVFKNCVVVLLLLKRSKLFQRKISYTLESLPKSKWTTFLDNLNFLKDQNTLTIELLQILLQELISKEKAYQPFWTPAYKALSERLLLPTEIDSQGLDTNLLSSWSQRQEEQSPSFKKMKTEHVNRNLQMTFSPSSMSSLVGKWEKEAIPIEKIKTLRIKIYPTSRQKEVLNEFIDTARYVYNRAIETIEKGHRVNFQNLRDLLVTENTKKHLEEYKAFDSSVKTLKEKKKQTNDKKEIEDINQEIKVIQQQRRNAMKHFEATLNINIKPFETKTPKDIRSNAVNQCCSAYKSGFSNLKQGNIKFFKMKYKKKTAKRQTIELTPKLISIKKGEIRIVPSILKDECTLKVSRKNSMKIKDLKISNNVDIVRDNGDYHVHLIIPTKPVEQGPLERIAGVDLGLRKFATIHTNTLSGIHTTVTEYTHRRDDIKKLNKKIDSMKQTKGKRCRSICYRNIERRKANLVNRLHWDFINDLLKDNDVIYLGDIKSHDIVKGGKNKYVNREFNDLKFYKLKERCIYKASLLQKRVFLVPEHHTTKTCSCCGEINHNVGSKEVFSCNACHFIAGRDINASKNIKMKGCFH